MQRKALDVARGQLIVVVADGEARLAVKVEREGKDYIHHYAVPLHPRHAPDRLALIYLDPEDMVFDLGRAATFDLGPLASDGAAIQAGDLFVTPRGRFFKVIDDPRNAKPHTYVDPARGDLVNRQERDVQAIHREWRVIEIDLEAVLAPHRRR